MTTKTWFEKTWKPVKLSGSSSKMYSSYSTNTSVSTYEDFQNLMEMSEEHIKCIKIYDQMDKTVDISRSLDIIAEDISSDNADDDDVFFLKFEEGYNVKKTEVKTYNNILSKWEKRTDLNYNFYNYARELIKYGIVLFDIEKDGSLKKLPIHEFVSASVDKNTGKITYFREDPKDSNVAKKLIPYKEEDIMVWKLGEGVFGESILSRVYKMWRALALLEEAVVIYRIVRAPERRVFYVDQGGLNEAKSARHLKQFAAKIKQKLRIKDNKQDSDFNPLSMQEDYFIGVKSDSRSSRVETLPGGENLGEIRDLNHFNKKLAFGLRVPISWFDSENPRDYNDGRVGTQYISELRYVGFIKRIQKIILKEIFPNFKNFSQKEDVEIPDEVFMRIALPQSFAIYKQNEMYSQLLNTLSSSDGLEYLSKKKSIEKFLFFEKDEIEENEHLVLLELGISEKDIKKLPNHVISNLVYGDKRLLSEIDTFLNDSNKENKDLTVVTKDEDQNNIPKF